MKIFCIGRNYIDHAKELNNAVPSSPMIFMKPPTAKLKKGYPFYIPNFTDDLHYEVEVILKICKNGKTVEKEFAHRYYDQIGLGIDFTARDLQSKLKSKGHPWEIAKAFDNSAIVGDFKEKSTFTDMNNINFGLNINDKTVQQGNTKDLIFDFDTLIVHISKFFTLQVGDLIYTGTPAGVGNVKPGDTLEGFLEDDKMFELEIK